MKKILFFSTELLATFWFVPVLTICFAVLASLALVSLDHVILIPQNYFTRFIIVDSLASARSILTTISGAMIGVAGTVFSVTLVALTLASSQFGPRLIKNFMYVRLNQIVLGSYISTYLYCLLVLNAIKDSDGHTFIPAISILVAILTAIANIILLIIFIHNIAVSIQADKIISDISETITKQVEALFPEKNSDDNDSGTDFDETAAFSEYSHKISIKSHKTGYLQYVDSKSLLNVVTKNESLLKLHQKPGAFLVNAQEIGIVYTNKDWEEETVKSLLDQFIIGKTKTIQQNLEFSINQMVEIGARALSPGVNDPYTAIACIDNLTATMCYLADAKFPSKYQVDEKGTLRVIDHVLKFEGVLDAAFNQIRQYSGNSTAVIIRLIEALNTIFVFTKTTVSKKAVIKHAEMIFRHGKQNITEENDISDLNKRAHKILK